MRVLIDGAWRDVATAEALIEVLARVREPEPEAPPEKPVEGDE